MLEVRVCKRESFRVGGECTTEEIASLERSRQCAPEEEKREEGRAQGSPWRHRTKANKRENRHSFIYPLILSFPFFYFFCLFFLIFLLCFTLYPSITDSPFSPLRSKNVLSRGIYKILYLVPDVGDPGHFSLHRRNVFLHQRSLLGTSGVSSLSPRKML